jgi:CotH kinase protein/Chitobiase/beta-hexosaminidase C-terminal domain
MPDRAPPATPPCALNHLWFLVFCLLFACSPESGSGDPDGSAGGGGQASAAGGGQAGGGAGPGGGGSASGGGTGSGGGSGSGGQSGDDAGRAPEASSDGGVAAPTMKPQPSLIGGVTFSVPSQSFRGELKLSMSTSEPSAEIRYTTDGTLPSASSRLFGGEALTLTATTQLRAQAFAAGAAAGKPSTALYVARTFDASSDLPIMIVEGYGGGKPSDKEVYKDAAIMVFEPVNGTASLSALPTVATRAGYHVRGQSSARAEQTPYRLEFWDNAGEDADYALLGMPADSDWALIAPYWDRSIVRNPLVYEIGREIGLAAPRVRFAEVYINYTNRPLEAGDYQGVYWVTETIKNHGDRVDLKQLRDTDKTLPAISGGYIFKFDQAAAEEPKIACTGSPAISGGFGGGFGGAFGGGFGGMGTGSGTGTPAPTGGGTCWVDLEVVDPDPLLPEQAAWLKDYLQKFHASLHETPIGDYAASSDVATFVDYLIINELTRNVDAYVRSAFYHKDRDGKIKAGPLWDYNFSLGVGGSGSVNPAGGFQYAGTRNVNNWYPKLTADPAFMARVKQRWAELRKGVLADAAVGERITKLSAPLARAALRDFEKWTVAAVLPAGAFVRGPSAPTWEGQVQALRDFVIARSAWLDMQWR